MHRPAKGDKADNGGPWRTGVPAPRSHCHSWQGGKAPGLSHRAGGGCRCRRGGNRIPRGLREALLRGGGPVVGVVAGGCPIHSETNFPKRHSRLDLRRQFRFSGPRRKRTAHTGSPVCKQQFGNKAGGCDTPKRMFVRGWHARACAWKFVASPSLTSGPHRKMDASRYLRRGHSFPVSRGDCRGKRTPLLLERRYSLRRERTGKVPRTRDFLILGPDDSVRSMLGWVRVSPRRNTQAQKAR
jgi:hypothetical protein